MYIALAVIMITFSFTTDGLFLSSRNISNLINQTGYIAVLAIGMTLVIVIRHIDLSVGFLSGFLGAICAIMLTSWGWPVYIAIPLILVFGIFIGFFNGFLVAQVGIPAFVASLAGWLIFRGLLLWVTENSGTIVINDKYFNAIGNGFIPDIANVGTFHLLTVILGAIAILLYVWSESRSRAVKLKYKFEVISMSLFVIKLIFLSGIIAYITYILAGYNGLSWTIIIVAVTAAIYHFVTTKTVLKTYLCIGGNPEARKTEWCQYQKDHFCSFCSMGMLSALSGILFASRLQSATTTAGTLFELDAIAAAYVGGVSAAGGVGKITGSLVGALVMSSLVSGMNLMGVGIYYQYIIRGAVLVAAVVFDVTTRKASK